MQSACRSRFGKANLLKLKSHWYQWGAQALGRCWVFCDKMRQVFGLSATFCPEMGLLLQDSNSKVRKAQFLASRFSTTSVWSMKAATRCLKICKTGDTPRSLLKIGHATKDLPPFVPDFIGGSCHRPIYHRLIRRTTAPRSPLHPAHNRWPHAISPGRGYRS